MGAKLNELSRDIGNSVFFTTEFITYISSHLKFIREHSSTTVMELDKGLIHKNMNDFYGLFMDMGIRYEDHQLVMLINSFTDPFSLTEEVESILMPSGNLVDTLKTLFRTVVI